MHAARKQLRWFRRAFDVLSGQAGDQIPGQILDQTDTGAFRREVQVARRCRADRAGIDVDVEHVGDERRSCSVEVDVLDASGDLCLGGVAELEFVEDIAGDPLLLLGSHNPLSGLPDRRDSVRSVPDATGLHADRGCQRSEAQR